MPNWCMNHLRVYGDKKEAEKFWKDGQNKDAESKELVALSLQKLYPLPEELKGTTSPSVKPNKELKKKYGYDNWYDWQVGHWGTKWDLCEVHGHKKKNGTLEYDFDTAWSPPLNAIIKISRDYPNLSFCLDYDEPGMEFRGKVRIKNGLELGGYHDG